MPPLLRAAISLSQKQAALYDEINLAFGVAVFIFLVFGGVVAIVQVKSDLREALLVGMSLPSLLTLAGKELTEVKKRPENRTVISVPSPTSALFVRSVFAASNVNETRKLAVTVPSGICPNGMTVESSGHTSSVTVSTSIDIPAATSSLKLTCQSARSEQIEITPGTSALDIVFSVEKDPWYGFYFGLGIRSTQYILRVKDIQVAKDPVETPLGVTSPVILRGDPEPDSVALHPSGRAIAWVGKDSQRLELWRIEEGRVSHLTKTGTVWTRPGLLKVGFGGDGHSIYGATDRSVIEWNADTGEPKKLHFSNCAGDYFGGASIFQSALVTWHYRDGATCFFKIPSPGSSMNPMKEVRRVTSKFSSVSMTATRGDELYIVDESRTAIEVMNLQSRARVRELRVPKNMGFVLDMQMTSPIVFLVRRKDGGVSTCEGEVFSCKDAPVGLFRFGRLAPDGRLIALWGGSEESSVTLWERLTWRRVGEIKEVPKPTTAVFSADSRHVGVTGGGFIGLAALEGMKTK